MNSSQITDPVNTHHCLHYRMDNIEEFVTACDLNNVIEVRRMISEGVNINGMDSDGHTGLIVAMGHDNTEVSRILLSCNNIKIDTKDKIGSTALHSACLNNHIESVKLFLEHPTCNKESVSVWGHSRDDG